MILHEENTNTCVLYSSRQVGQDIENTDHTARIPQESYADLQQTYISTLLTTDVEITCQHFVTPETAL